MNFRATSRLFRFGLFEADLQNAQLTRKGVRIRLQEQPFRILTMLLSRPGQVITREELRQELWPTGTYVDFDGSLNAALKRLRAALDDDADNPRFIETVSKRGYRFIAPVTVEDSPVSGEVEIPTLLHVPAAEHQDPTPNATPSNLRSRPWIAVFGVAMVAVVMAITAFFVLRNRVAVPPVSPTRATVDVGTLRHSIAVLGFQNASGRSSDAWLSTALPEMLRTELGAGGKLRVIPGESVAQFRVGSPWSETDSLSRQTASRIGKALDSDLLVLGSFAALGEPQDGSVRVDFRLQDAQTGEILYEGAESGTENQFFGLVAKVGVALRERLGLPMISESEEVGVVSSLPSDPDANRFYSLGLQKLREADVAAARDLLLQAEKLAPRFPLVHLMLCQAWGALGYDQKASSEIKTAYQLSAGLPETDKLQVEGAYFQNLKQLDKAAAAYRALYTLYPDSVDYAEQFIVVLRAAGRREEALAILKQLRQLPPPASEDPRIDFWQGQLATDTSTAQPFFDKAVAEAASRGQKLLYAQFRLKQCINLIYGVHPQGSEVHCQEAYDIFMAAGNRLSAADALRAMGDRRGAEGDLNGARETYQHALAIFNELGEHEKIGVVLNNMAITYENQGQIAQAEKLFRQAAEGWKQCGDTLNEATAFGNLADTFMLRGELRKAEEHYQQAQRQVELTEPNGAAYELHSIAAVRLYEGDVTGALRYAREALAVSSSAQPVEIAQIREVLGDIRLAQDDLPGARKSYQQALALRQQLGNRGQVAEIQAELSDVSLEEGKFSEAEVALRESLAEFRSGDLELSEASAGTDLARILLHQGKLTDARQVISDALALSATSSDPSLKLPILIQEARIETAELAARTKSKPDLSDPRRKLKSVIFTASRLGYYGIECDARLALGEIELRSDPAAARAHLALLAAQAHDHGLELISHKAAELEKSSATLAKL